MKADPAVQRRLLDLAEVDAELSRLAHRRRTLPEVAELAVAEAAVRTAKDKLVEVETQAGDLDRDIRRIERDVEGVRTRTERDNQLLAGSGIAAKQAADLRHHPASEHLLRPGSPALVDVAHWASEWPWCEQAAGVVRAALGGSVEVRVSRLRTDPWTLGRTI